MNCRGCQAPEPKATNADYAGGRQGLCSLFATGFPEWCHNMLTVPH